MASRWGTLTNAPVRTAQGGRDVVPAQVFGSDHTSWAKKLPASREITWARPASSFMGLILPMIAPSSGLPDMRMPVVPKSLIA